MNLASSIPLLMSLARYSDMHLIKDDSYCSALEWFANVYLCAFDVTTQAILDYEVKFSEGAE